MPTTPTFGAVDLIFISTSIRKYYIFDFPSTQFPRFFLGCTALNFSLNPSCLVFFFFLYSYVCTYTPFCITSLQYNRSLFENCTCVFVTDPHFQKRNGSTNALYSITWNAPANCHCHSPTYHHLSLAVSTMSDSDDLGAFSEGGEESMGCFSSM